MNFGLGRNFFFWVFDEVDKGYMLALGGPEMEV